MPHALMRSVPDSFTEALVDGDRPSIDVAEARRQHDAYRVVLAAAGYEVMMLPADEAHPDCPFVEDTAVIVGETAVIARPGAPSRRGEVGPVATALQPFFPVAAITEPGTLDGGDVMRLGDEVFVGRSSRTNEEGIDQLSQVCAASGLAVRPVQVNKVLHLKSAVLPLDAETVLISARFVNAEAFGDYRVIDAAPREHVSVLPLGDKTVMATARATDTIDALHRSGFAVEPIDVSQFQAADGGLTCLSILW